MSKYFGIPFANSGDKSTIPDASQIDGSVNFTDGYTPDYSKDQATDPDAKDIPRQSENYFKFSVTDAIKEIQELGGRPYENIVNYPIGARTVASDNLMYICLIVNGPATTVRNPVGDGSGSWILSGSSKIISHTTSGSYSKPDGLVGIKVTVVGGGGAGGGVDGQGVGTWAGGGGGGGGGTSIKQIIAEDLASSETVTIGAGGAGLSGNADGNDGGTTSFGSHCSAGGGIGGGGDLASSAVKVNADGGVGGIGLNGDIDIKGEAGYPAVLLGFAISRNFSGRGGDSSIGHGGKEATVVEIGIDGVGYGSGGSGSLTYDVDTDRAGGYGADGVVIIEEFF